MLNWFLQSDFVPDCPLQAKALRDCFWNGQLEAQQAKPPTHKVFPSHFRIGSTHDAEYFDGEIDDVAIFGRALDDDEIVQAMARQHRHHFHFGPVLRPMAPPQGTRAGCARSDRDVPCLK